ncbi:MAG TPA: DUF3501 family protein [Polyangiaceae bacterium]|jgi:hypothetical protein
MRPIERGEILGLAEYEQIRGSFRSRVIAQKKRRRVQVGPKASAVFENRDTVLLQIQEMLRTERITRPGAVQHELDTYNELIPGDGEISCTLMVEIADKDEREAFLVAAKGLEKHVWLVAGSQRVQARSVDRGGTDARTTAVHYLRFRLPPVLVEALRSAATGDATVTHLELVVDHPAYEARAVLPLETIVELGEDQTT